MKKIIELAEKVLDALPLPGSEITQEMTDALLKLSKAVKDRKTLEQTPITEEWLNEHGFNQQYEKNHLGELHRYEWENGFQHFVIWRNKGYFECGMLGNFRVKTLAGLYDAANLCGINRDFIRSLQND